MPRLPPMETSGCVPDRHEGRGVVFIQLPAEGEARPCCPAGVKGSGRADARCVIATRDRANLPRPPRATTYPPEYNAPASPYYVFGKGGRSAARSSSISKTAGRGRGRPRSIYRVVGISSECRRSSTPCMRAGDSLCRSRAFSSSATESLHEQHLALRKSALMLSRLGRRSCHRGIARLTVPADNLDHDQPLRMRRKERNESGCLPRGVPPPGRP